MDEISLEELVRTHINLPNRPSAQGWSPILCKVCNDHGRKGPRAGFKIENGIVGYHCFNCQAKSSIDPSKHRTISKNMEEILLAFGVPELDINRVRMTLLGAERGESSEPRQVSNHEPKEIPLPSHFYRLPKYPNGVWTKVAKAYLEERCIDPDSYPFMLSTGEPTDLNEHPKEVHKTLVRSAQKWPGRIITPIYKNEKLVFYVGRDMTDKKMKKYESPSTSRRNVIYGFDQLFEDTTRPLYVVEGIFDAMVVNGVAILGNELSDSHLYWLNRSNRQKVYIPDRFGDGHINAFKAIEHGWSVGFPDIGTCKDVNAAVQKYGSLYVLASISQNTADGFEAKARIGLYCK